MKIKYKIALVLLSFFVIGFVFLSNLSYDPPSKKEINKRLNYLDRMINQPLDSNSDIIKLGLESPEFMLFTYSYSTYALTNLAVKDSIYRERAIPLIKESINKVLDDKVSYPYDIDREALLSDSIPEYSVLYLGHLNLMLGCYRLLSDDTSFNELNDRISTSLFSRYNATLFLNLESYPFQIWIPDNTVAIASLKLHSFNAGSNYEMLCDRWVSYAKEHYLDNSTKTLYSTVDATVGDALEEPRGSMLGWSIMFIYQFDSDFALELYNNYKQNFSVNYGVFRLFKERWNSSETNVGDIDSGPIIFGFSIPANEFSLGGSILAEDYKTASQQQRLISIGAKKYDVENEIRYKVRFVDMNIRPMAEALVLNSLTICKWVE